MNRHHCTNAFISPSVSTWQFTMGLYDWIFGWLCRRVFHQVKIMIGIDHRCAHAFCILADILAVTSTHAQQHAAIYATKLARYPRDMVSIEPNVCACYSCLLLLLLTMLNYVAVLNYASTLHGSTRSAPHTSSHRLTITKMESSKPWRLRLPFSVSMTRSMPGRWCNG